MQKTILTVFETRLPFRYYCI